MEAETCSTSTGATELSAIKTRGGRGGRPQGTSQSRMRGGGESKEEEKCLEEVEVTRGPDAEKKDRT